MPDLHHDRLPDTLGEALRQVIERLDRLENKIHVHEEGQFSPDQEGFWIGSDFSI
jgi:hypothetical protein